MNLAGYSFIFGSTHNWTWLDYMSLNKIYSIFGSTRLAINLQELLFQKMKTFKQSIPTFVMIYMTINHEKRSVGN